MIRPTLLFLLLFGLVACSESPYDGYEQEESGLYWRLEAFNDRSRQPQTGDFVEMSIAYRTLTDSILMISSTHIRGGTLIYRLDEMGATGGFREGLRLMHEGDSMSFILPVTTFFGSYLNTAVPAALEGAAELKVDVHLLNVWSQAEYEEKEAQREAELLQMEMDEQANLLKYINETGLDSSLLFMGVWIEQLEAGTGDTIRGNDFINITFTGSTLDGVVFDPMKAEGRSMDYLVGKPETLIDGLMIAVRRMKKGEKARIIIPSRLGFGAKGVPGIVPPYTTLIYELEILNVTRS